jgi:hypothetical protein
MAYQSSSVSMSHLISESYGHSLKSGGHPLNAGNFNDTINRQYVHGYFKPRFAEWPTGGYTRKETLHRVRSGLLDTSPQRYEWIRHGYDKSLALQRGVRQSNLASLSERQLMEHAEKHGGSGSLKEKSEATESTLNMATNIHTTGLAYEPQGKYVQVSDPYAFCKPPSFLPLNDRRITRSLSDFNAKRFGLKTGEDA